MAISVQNKQRIIDYMLNVNNMVSLNDVVKNCRLQPKAAEKYLATMVSNGLVKIDRQIGLPSTYRLR